ncbi:hypothetical protein GCM10023187_31130 [Nibrella viscosa]|uniref:DUF115 domain-containing protein n=1 Tax=Nibrella viscosa TaxID=1084524 RepID=A0ABP8KJN5_9BACT
MKYLDLNIPRILLFWLDTVARNWYYRFKVVIRNYGYLQQTRRLKGSKRAKQAIVLANGPSVAKLDPQKIARLQQESGFEVFAVNSYISSPLAEVVVPDYYLLSDPAFFYPERYPHLTERLQRDMALLSQTDITCFVPLEHYRKAPFRKKFGYYDRGNLFLSRITITGPRSYISMTSYKALAAACYMGYSQIYICGFDNDYFLNLMVDEHNDMYYIDKHFYDRPGAAPSRVRDTHANSVGELLYFHHYLFKHLEKFKNYPIVNLNRQGLVDSFPKQHTLDIYKTTEVAEA